MVGSKCGGEAGRAAKHFTERWLEADWQEIQAGLRIIWRTKPEHKKSNRLTKRSKSTL